MKVILTHEHADFDAVASLAGLALLVTDAVPVLPMAVNANVADFLLLYGDELALRHREDLPRERVEHAWLVDTVGAQAVRGMSAATMRSVLDHHAESRAAAAGIAEMDVQEVGATSTLVTERLAAAGVAPSVTAATLLLLGIYEDTGSLAFPGTTARDLRAAAWLLTAGADLSAVPRFLRQTLSEPERSLLAALHEDARPARVGGHPLEVAGRPVMVATATAVDFEGALGVVVGKLADLLEPAALFALVDLGRHVQLVARRAFEGVDVGVVAAALGGGGHAHAAAAVVRDLDLAGARSALEAALPDSIRPQPRVADIMSAGRVRTIDASATVTAALAVSRRHGHEGYPVVADGRVVGVVTRRDLDRAAHHRLGAMLVSGLLAGPGPRASPEDSIESVTRAMMDADVGQVPVVEGGRLIGIVTRTDVLRHWSGRRAEQVPLARDVAAGLAEILGDRMVAVRAIAAAAEARGERAYLVGGLPRDLLLGRPPGPDVDVVIAGDAPAVARAVVAKRGGRLRTHDRFGTAKWFVDGGEIDLITARSEYYRAPTALPSVSRGTLRSDLRRRDFTINTLAIELSDSALGRLIDLFGGLADLERRTVRVLHSLSFVEDPTRILRAVRFAVRLGFELDPHTAALARESVGLLARVSGARLRAELRLLASESGAAAALEQLEAMGALDAIHPGLAAGSRTRRLIARLPRAWSAWRRQAPDLPIDERPTADDALAVWLAAQGRVGVEAAARLALPRKRGQLVAETVDLVGTVGPAAERDAPPSELRRQLHGRPPEALCLAWLVADRSALRRNLRRFAVEVAGAPSLLTGADLAELGLAPGPEYGRILGLVRDAALDGLVRSRAEALAMARELVGARAGLRADE